MLTNATETSEKVRKLTPNLSAIERNKKLKEMKQWLQTHYKKESTLSEQWMKNKKGKRIIQNIAFPPSLHEGATAAIKNKTNHVTHYHKTTSPPSPPECPSTKTKNKTNPISQYKNIPQMHLPSPLTVPLSPPPFRTPLPNLPVNQQMHQTNTQPKNTFVNPTTTPLSSVLIPGQNHPLGLVAVAEAIPGAAKESPIPEKGSNSFPSPVAKSQGAGAQVSTAPLPESSAFHASPGSPESPSQAPSLGASGSICLGQLILDPRQVSTANEEDKLHPIGMTKAYPWAFPSAPSTPSKRDSSITSGAGEFQLTFRKASLTLEPSPALLIHSGIKQKHVFAELSSPWDIQLCVAKLGYTMSPTIKANSFEVRWGTHTSEPNKIATIVFEPGIRHWVVQTNGRNLKFISNLTATHQALQTELGISSISGGTTIVSAPIMSSYQELLEFAFANLQRACPGIIITEQIATGKGINNSGYKAKCGLTGGTVTITANHGVQSAPCFKIDGKAFLRQHVVATVNTIPFGNGVRHFGFFCQKIIFTAILA